MIWLFKKTIVNSNKSLARLIPEKKKDTDYNSRNERGHVTTDFVDIKLDNLNEMSKYLEKEKLPKLI